MSEFIQEDPCVTEEEVCFQVNDDQTAEWCLNKIREANAEKERWTEFYMGQLKKVCDREDNRIAFMEMKLMAYFGSVPHKVTKTQESYQLPGGKLVYKKQSPEYEREEGTLLDWMDHKPEMERYIKVRETVDWAELKKVLTVSGGRMLTEDGEIVPGITVTERPDKFVVEVK